MDPSSFRSTRPFRRTVRKLALLSCAALPMAFAAGCASSDNQSGPSTAADQYWRSGQAVQVGEEQPAQIASDRQTAGQTAGERGVASDRQSIREGQAPPSTDRPVDNPNRAIDRSAPQKINYDDKGRREGDLIIYTMPFPTGDRATSALLIEKTVPVQVRVGQPFNYQIKVTNTSKNAAEGVEVSETVGRGFTIDRSEPASRGEATNGALTWPVGNLAPGQSRTVTVTAVAEEQGQVSSCLSASYNPTLCAPIAVVQPELRLTKTATSQADICEPITFEYVVTNTGTGRTEPITLREQLPEGLKTEDGKNAINADVGALAQGESKRVTVRLKADKPGQFTSRALATARGADVAAAQARVEARAAADRGDNRPDAKADARAAGDQGDNRAQAADRGMTAQSQSTTTTVVQPSLAVNIEGPEVEYVNRPATYRVTVTNNGTAQARDAVASVKIPQGYRILESGDARASAGNIQWSLGAIPPKESKTASFTVEARQADTFKATANAQANCAQQVSANSQTRFLTISALRLEVIDDNDPVRVGDNVVYTIQVLNQGNGPDSNVHIIANLPPEQEFVSATGATKGQVSEDKRHVDFGPVPKLGPGEAATWKVTCKANGKGDTRFEVQLQSDTLTKPAMETEPTRLY